MRHSFKINWPYTWLGKLECSLKNALPLLVNETIIRKTWYSCCNRVPALYRRPKPLLRSMSRQQTDFTDFHSHAIQHRMNRNAAGEQIVNLGNSADEHGATKLGTWHVVG